MSPAVLSALYLRLQLKLETRMFVENIAFTSLISGAALEYAYNLYTICALVNENENNIEDLSYDPRLKEMHLVPTKENPRFLMELAIL